MRALFNPVIAVMLMAAAGILAGCDVTTPSQVNLGQIQLKETYSVDSFDVFHPDAAKLDQAIDRYQRSGRGPVTLTLSFVKDDQQMLAKVEHQADFYYRALHDRGIKDVRLEYAPVGGEDDAGKIILSYPSLKAEAAEGCGRIPGYRGADKIDDMDQYRIGCETQAMVSQMVSDPGDLMGHSGVESGDSRRQGGVVEKYKAGTPNQKMNGLNASSIGSGGGG